MCDGKQGKEGGGITKLGGNIMMVWVLGVFQCRTVARHVGWYQME